MLHLEEPVVVELEDLGDSSSLGSDVVSEEGEPIALNVAEDQRERDQALALAGSLMAHDDLLSGKDVRLGMVLVGLLGEWVEERAVPIFQDGVDTLFFSKPLVQLGSLGVVDLIVLVLLHPLAHSETSESTPLVFKF
jgi:hypothetical protein